MILLTIILPQKSGRTALMLAAMEGDLDTVRLLISAGADASITDQVCDQAIFIDTSSCNKSINILLCVQHIKHVCVHQSSCYIILPVFCSLGTKMLLPHGL